MIQELIAFSIVGFVAAMILWNAYRALLAEPISKWFLKRGKIKLAMWLRASGKGCH